MTDNERLIILTSTVDHLHLVLCREMGARDVSDPEIALENVARLLGDAGLFREPSVAVRIEAELADLESDLHLFDNSRRREIRESFQRIRDGLSNG